MAMRISKIRKKAAAGEMLTTGEAGALKGVSGRTILNYEKQGLIPDARTATGYRRYWPETVDKFWDKLDRERQS